MIRRGGELAGEVFLQLPDHKAPAVSTSTIELHPAGAAFGGARSLSLRLSHFGSTWTVGNSVNGRAFSSNPRCFPGQEPSHLWKGRLPGHSVPEHRVAHYQRKSMHASHVTEVVGGSGHRRPSVAAELTPCSAQNSSHKIKCSPGVPVAARSVVSTLSRPDALPPQHARGPRLNGVS